jgi:hypothetical protein
MGNICNRKKRRTKEKKNKRKRRRKTKDKGEKKEAYGGNLSGIANELENLPKPTSLGNYMNLARRNKGLG